MLKREMLLESLMIKFKSLKEGQNFQDHRVFLQPKILLFSVLLQAGKVTWHVPEVLQKDNETFRRFWEITTGGFWRAISLYSAS